MADMSLDVNDLTMRDLADFEDIVGADLFQVLPTSPEALEGFKPSAKVMVALVYLTGRKKDPAFTLDDAYEVKIADLDLTRLKVGESDPTSAAG